MDTYRSVDGKLLRCGLTTGSTATAATVAAATLLLGGTLPPEIRIAMPKGGTSSLEPVLGEREGEEAVAAVRKDGGDDPDITHGLLIYSRVSLIPKGIEIDGGEGVGRVTAPGLDQPVGNAAINSTPRRMIRENLENLAQAFDYPGGFKVVISVPGGEKAAQKTFNPRMGIKGGISIIGTTGIVEPMSHAAIRDTVRLEIRQCRARGHDTILLAPGNYGERFIHERLGLDPPNLVSSSNWIGDALDTAVGEGFKKILLVGHVGKIAKLGLMTANTHSSQGDGRMECLMASALEAGADLELLKNILHCVTTDAALDLIREAGLLGETMAVLSHRVESFLSRHVPEEVEAGILCFSWKEPGDGILFMTPAVPDLIEYWRTLE